MQLAIEKQQNSLHENLDLKRKNDVNVREQNDVPSHTASIAANDDDRFSKCINRSTALPSLVSECERSNVPASGTSGTCAPPRKQNYDQYRDAVRASYVQYDSIEYATRQGAINSFLPNEKLSPTVVASSIKDQKCLTTAGTSSSNTYNSVYEVMGRGRNRNKHRGGGSSSIYQNNNRSAVKIQRESGHADEACEVTSENSNVNVTNGKVGQSPEPQAKQNPNIAASADENSEKSASISCENVLRDDENSCSNNSRRDNKNDNIAASDEEKTAAYEATNIVIGGARDGKDGLLADDEVAGVKNDEQMEQQVGAVPLQRNPSAKRVTFAPSPPRSVASSSSDDEETISEDIFYEAEAPNETQKLRILSTVTSHSSDCVRIDEESSEADVSTSSGESSSSHSYSTISNNDVVCAKIILSVNENERSKPSDNENKTDNIKSNAFSSSDETSISDDVVESAPKTIKPSYLMVGEDTIALPDIVAETSLLEQQQHLEADDM